MKLQELQLKHQALEAFHETVDVFDEQLRLHDRYKKKAAPQELPKYARPITSVMFSLLHKYIALAVGF